MAADLTFKIDAEASGLEGVVNNAIQKLQKFGETGGLVGRAMGAVSGTVKSAEGALSSFAATGKGAVAMLNHINGAVELANKIIPALTFPLAMAENAQKTKDAFDGMTTAWGEVAGALGEGVNDALTPILVSAGLEIGKLKEEARKVGQGIGAAIDLTRVSYQMGNLGELAWLGIQKTMLQWGAMIPELVVNFGFELNKMFNWVIDGAIALFSAGMASAMQTLADHTPKWLGKGSLEAGAAAMNAKADAASARMANPDNRVADAQKADAIANIREFFAPVQEQADALGKQMDALIAPMKEQISKEKELTKAAEAKAKEDREAGEAAKALADQFKPFFGGDAKGGGGGGGGGGRGPGVTVAPPPKGWNYGKKISDFHSKEPIPPPGGEQAPAEMPDKRKGHGTHHIKGAGFGKKASPREGLSYFNTEAMAKPATPKLDAIKGAGHKLDPAALVNGVTNKTGAKAAAKQERAAEQKDAVSAKAAEAVATSLPQMQKDLAMLAKKLNVELK